MSVAELETHEEVKDLLDKNPEGRVVVIDFSATWCPPCRMISPQLDALNKEKSDVDIFMVDVDTNEESAKYFSISKMPTIKFFKGPGLEAVDEIVGGDMDKIREILEGLCTKKTVSAVL